MDSSKQGIDWNAVFLEHRPQLLRAAFKVLGNIQAAQDVVQSAYVKLSEANHGEDLRQPAAYLFRMVRNLAIDTQRRTALESGFLVDVDYGEVAAASGETPESRLGNQQELHIVAAALATLPERTRDAFELHRLNGLTQREVGAQLGVSTTLVNFMIRDAMLICSDALSRAAKSPAQRPRIQPGIKNP